MRSSFDRPRSATALRAALLLLGLLPALATELRAAPPTVSHILPAGGQRGTKVAVTCTGTFTWPVQIWAPGLEVTVGTDSGKLEITIPEQLPADRVWLRLYNAEGASAAIPFLIGSLPEVAETEPNNAGKQAQIVPASGTTINGALQAGGDVDTFAVDLTAGQTLVAALDAHTRLGSPMDAILQVAAPDGTVLAENHDDVGLDPRLAYTAKTDGRHLVRLFAFPSDPNTNIGFAGGANYVYRLTVTTGPYITHALPLSVNLAEPGQVIPLGWNLPADARLPVVPLGGDLLGEHAEREPLTPLQITHDARPGIAFAPQFAGSAAVRLVPHPALAELAPGDAQPPFTLVPPVAVTGLLKSPRETNTYQIPLQKGQQLVVSAESSSLGLPVVPALRLTDPKGAVAARIDPGTNTETLLVHAATQDGNYTLAVSDRYRHGGDRYSYRLTVRLGQPDFEFAAAADALTIPHDKPLEVPLTITRRGAVGPITFTIEGLPPGVTVPAVVSEPTGPTAAKVTLACTSDGTPFSGPIRIVGTAAMPQETKRFARTPTRLGATFETLWLTTLAKPN